jgi:hypothetical protein
MMICLDEGVWSAEFVAELWCKIIVVSWIHPNPLGNSAKAILVFTFRAMGMFSLLKGR